jgi:ATP-binding cassette subfamily B multidrug efflux pump
MTTVTPPAYVIESEEQYAKGYDPRVVARLIEYIHPYRWRLLLGIFLMTLGSAVAVAGPYLVKIALDSGMSAGNVVVLRNTVIVYFLAICFQWVVTFFRVNIMAVLGQSIIYDLRARLFEHIQALSLNFFSHYSVGRVITRVINDVGTLRDFLTWAITAVARDIFTLIGIIVAMMLMNARLSLLTFTVLPVMAVATYLFRRRSRLYYRKVRSAVSWVNSVLAENINGVRVVQAFSRQQYNYRHFSTQPNHYLLDMTIQTAKLAAIFLPTIDILGTIATVIVVMVGGAAVLGETITPGILVAFILYIDRFFEPIRDLSRRFDTFQSTMAGGERLLQLLDTEIEVKDLPQAVELAKIQGDINFENVSFHYSDDPSLVLKNINLHVQPGETVALVGETGAGKTTLIKLIARFHDPTGGRILVDGHDLCTVTQHSLRSQMGIVLQEPFLFSGTIRDNIRFGRLEASESEIESAARAVGAHDFILNLRDEYDTDVEEGGVLLSVGQRQLISFARALLADPRILILDEATSSVDTQTERIIQSALERLLRNRTAFVIAHRLSTVVNADHIVVIENGTIIEQGTHSDLLTQKGKYYQLYRLGFED